MGVKCTQWCKNPIKNIHLADYKSVVCTDRNEPRYTCKVCGQKYSSKDLEITPKNGQYQPKRKIPTATQLYKKVLKCR